METRIAPGPGVRVAKTPTLVDWLWDKIRPRVEALIDTKLAQDQKTSPPQS